MGIKAPTLKELRTGPCTLEELQAAIVKLADHHNALVADVNRMIDSGQIQSSHEAVMSRAYGLTS